MYKRKRRKNKRNILKKIRAGRIKVNLKEGGK